MEEAVAGLASGFFKSDFVVAGYEGDIGFADDDRDIAFFAKCLAVGGVFFRFRALLVVEMGGDDVDSGLVEQVEKASGIGATAESDEDGGSFGDQAGFIKMSLKMLQHGGREVTNPGLGRGGSVHSGAWRWC